MYFISWLVFVTLFVHTDGALKGSNRSVWMLIKSWEGGGEVRQARVSTSKAMVGYRYSSDDERRRVIVFEVDGDLFAFQQSITPVESYRFPIRARNITLVDRWSRTVICRSAILCSSRSYDTRLVTTLSATQPVSRNWQLTGPLDTQKNIVFLSAGYPTGSIDVFYEKVAACVQFLQRGFTDDFAQIDINSQPYKRYFHATNIFSVFEPSEVTGAGNRCEGSDCGNNLLCLYGDDPKHRLRCSRELTLSLASYSPAYDLIITIVNSDISGGSGGNKIAYISSSDDMLPLLAHQLGHADGNLNDEYDFGVSELSNPPSWESNNCAPPQDPPAWHYWQNLTDAEEWGIHRWEIPVREPYEGCTFSNYQKATADCIMGNSHSEQMCPVCLESMTKSVYNSDHNNVIGTVHQSVGVLDVMAPRCPLPSQEVWLVFGEERFGNITLYNRGGLSTSDWSHIRNEKYPTGIEDTSGPYETERTISTSCTVRDAHNVIIGGIPDCVEGFNRSIAGISPHYQMDTITLQSIYLGPGLHTVRYKVTDRSRYLSTPIVQESEIIIRVVPHREFMPTQCGGSRDSRIHGHVKRCSFTSTDISENTTVASVVPFWDLNCEATDDTIGEAGEDFCFSCLEPTSNRESARLSDESEFLIECDNGKQRPTCDIDLMTTSIELPPLTVHPSETPPTAKRLLVASVGSLLIVAVVGAFWGFYSKRKLSRITPSSSSIFRHQIVAFLLCYLLLVVLISVVFYAADMFDNVTLHSFGVGSSVFVVVGMVFAFCVVVVVCLKSVRYLMVAVGFASFMLITSVMLTAYAFWLSEHIDDKRDSVRKTWIQKVDTDPTELCDWQLKHQCSGLTVSCQHSSWAACSGLPSECVCGCEFNYFEDPCWLSIRSDIISKLNDFVIHLVILNVVLFLTMCVNVALLSLVRERFALWNTTRREKSQLANRSTLTRTEITKLRSAIFGEAKPMSPPVMKQCLESSLGVEVALEKVQKQFLIWDFDRDGELSESEIRQSYLALAQAIKSDVNRNMSMFCNDERQLLMMQFRKANPLQAGSTRLSKSEFRDFMNQTLGIIVSPVEIDYYFYMLEAREQSGSIDLEEVLQIYNEVLDPSCIDIISLRSKFYEIDLNRDGSIDRNELGLYFKQLMSRYNSSEGLSDRQLDYYFRRMDINDDGRIEFDEFATVMEVHPLPPTGDVDVTDTFHYPPTEVQTPQQP